MVDSITVATYAAAGFILLPVLVLGLMLGAFNPAPAVLASSAGGEGALASPSLTQEAENTSFLAEYGVGNHDNPEQALERAYNQQAESEISRCTGSSAGNQEPLCQTTMSLLLKSCADPATVVAACSDPRLLSYQKTLT